MRQDWKTAKDGSKVNFKLAYDNWVQERKTADADVAKASSKEILGLAELEFGKECARPMNFGTKDLGPTLDNIEKYHAKAVNGLNGLDMSKLLKNKTVKSYWRYWAEKISFTLENYNFLTAGHKKKPQIVYRDYIVEDSSNELNIGSGLKERWDDCANANNWRRAGKDLIKDTYNHIYTMTESDSLGKIKRHETVAKFLRVAFGSKKLPGWIKNAQEACAEYKKTCNSYKSEWKNRAPDFWTQPSGALDTISENLTEIAELYPMD